MSGVSKRKGCTSHIHYTPHTVPKRFYAHKPATTNYTLQALLCGQDGPVGYVLCSWNGCSTVVHRDTEGGWAGFTHTDRVHPRGLV